MKTTATLSAFLLMSTTAHGAPPNKRVEPPPGIGVGIVLGVPTGVSLGYRIASKRHFSSALAWSAPDKSFHLHVDYLFEVTQVVDPNAPMYQFPLYAGLGMRIQADQGRDGDNESIMGIRAPVGLTFLPQVIPFEVFAEIVPVMLLYPSTDITFDGAFGARYYF